VCAGGARRPSRRQRRARRKVDERRAARRAPLVDEDLGEEPGAGRRGGLARARNGAAGRARRRPHASFIRVSIGGPAAAAAASAAAIFSRCAAHLAATTAFHASGRPTTSRARDVAKPSWSAVWAAPRRAHHGGTAGSSRTSARARARRSSSAASARDDIGGGG